jgi:outer membrane receptor for ferrienterochelin and colicin
MKFSSILKVIPVMLMTLLLVKAAPAQDVVPTGIIKGQVTDSETKAALPGVTVFVADTQTGSNSDTDGNFTIKNLPVGNYTLKFNCMGYHNLSKTDIIVKPKRIVFVQAELEANPLQMNDVLVSNGYFPHSDDNPTSSINFSAEEIRRSPGTAGDVSRILMTLPSVAKVNDMFNSLIVRGGSPNENGFFVDNIEIPNINHYPTQGSSGGPIGLINVDFIEDADFSSGGFSSAYGDRLSSVMNLSFREGNRDEFDGQLDMAFAGLGFTGEGPIASGKGSWLFSARKSYLDLLVDAIGTGVAPKYSDYQGKLVFDPNPNNKITLLGVLGVDYIKFEKTDSEDQGNSAYGTTRAKEGAAGINWRYLWSEKGYSNTAVSYFGTWGQSEYIETVSDALLSDNENLEQTFQIRNVSFFRFNPSFETEFGIDAKIVGVDYDNYLGPYTDPFGNPIPAYLVKDEFWSQKGGAFVNFSWKPVKRLTLSPGMRYDYFAYNENGSISPRFSFSFEIDDKTSLNGATGLYYQNLPLVLLTQQPENKDLRDPMAVHYILGINRLLTENTRLTLEVYNKEYRNFPIDPSTPSLFLIDEIAYRYFYFTHEPLTDVGKAYARGVELTVQKKLAEDIYGLVSGSYSRSRYKGGDGVWRDRVFDSQYSFSAEGGYKPNNKWEFSLRWIYAGGAPYTPFDLAASEAINRTVVDETRVNESRYPAYHSLNVRCDRRFHFKGSSIILYASVWNAYNRGNVAAYYWNEIERKQDSIDQWGLLPVIGMEYEF